MKSDDLNIKLVGTDDLILELLGRFDHAIFTGIQLGVKSADDYVTLRKWFGNSATCSGLCSQMEYAINKSNDSTATRITEQDL